jgi:Fe(3+) dicitrate transport protein
VLQIFDMKYLLYFSCVLSALTACAQNNDSVFLKDIEVRGYKTMNGVGHVNNYSGQVIFSGKKNEVLTIDSLDANKALNNTRQIIGRIPGLNIIETEAGGFTANGIGFRGVNPYQSIEMNTRQNGYNISADIFGYNEAYYLPPMEAVSNIEFMRGAAGLQFGPQLGGLVNYVLRDAPAKPIEMTVAQTAGSYGLYNIYTSIGGTKGRWQYFAFSQYRTLDGWRENSDQKQLSAYGKVTYNASSKVKLSVDYTLLRNKIHMPGGLNDSEFQADPQQSLRARNWLQSPWNIITANLQYKISGNTSLSFTSAYQFSQRDLIWQNEDSWYPNFSPDSIGAARELEKEFFNNLTNELRVLTNYKIGTQEQTLAFGIRQAFSLMRRYEGGIGSTAANLDLNQYGPYATAMNFRNNNVSLFAENIFHIGKKLSVTPGGRLEYLTTTAYGYAENEVDSTNVATPTLNINNQKNTRTFALGGIGAQYEISKKINAYTNCSQSYRPVTYSELTPFGTTAKIDPNLKDSKAVNADFGMRGAIKHTFNFDASLFYLYNYNGIGTVPSASGFLVTNTGASTHTGIETYGELNLNDLFFPRAHAGKLSIYNSFAYINAVYTAGAYNGNQVEYAPHVIERTGINYGIKGFECNAQYSYQSKSFGDASNAISDVSAETGIIPSYWILDFSASYKWSNYKASVGINNITDEKYFTLRTSEYPGPGIIPSTGRMIYAGLSLTF